MLASSCCEAGYFYIYIYIYIYIYMKLFSSSIQHVISKLLDLTVQRNAVKIVVDQTMTATTSMVPVFSVAMMDIKEKDARIVS